MKILLIEPYHRGSHKVWAEGLKKHSKNKIEILSLPGRNWKWRMHGGAITLAEEFKKIDKTFDLILATDMLDLTTFLALTRKRTHSTPVILYIHENQLGYPVSHLDTDHLKNRDNHYSFINYSSALSSDHVVFNSNHNKTVFLRELKNMLHKFPDFRNMQTINIIEKKSSVIYPGIDLSMFDNIIKNNKPNDIPIILWNHRWEYDKNPQGFLKAALKLKEQNINFKLVILGNESKTNKFTDNEYIDKLQDKIIKIGYADTREEYASWLSKADILPVTSFHDFFGMSVIEAVHGGCYPILPDRLAYPEIFSAAEFTKCFYKTDDELISKLSDMLQKKNIPLNNQFNTHTEQFDWRHIIEKYDNLFSSLRSGPCY